MPMSRKAAGELQVHAGSVRTGALRHPELGALRHLSGHLGARGVRNGRRRQLDTPLSCQLGR